MSRPSLSRRRAFTLVELLVVIAIIGVLVALLLPAIKRCAQGGPPIPVYESAQANRRLDADHVIAMGTFPTGGNSPNQLIQDYTSGGTSSPGRPNGPNKQGLGWAYQILPYLEQGAVKNIVRQIDLQQATVPGYYCPSRRSAEKVQGATGLTVLMDYAAAHPMTYVCTGSPSSLPSSEKLDINKTVPFVGATSYAEAFRGFWCGSNGPPLPNGVYDGVIVRAPI